MACPGPTVCVAVGESNGSIAAIWNGKHWRLQRPPVPHGSQQGVLFGVACPTTSMCMAVGEAVGAHGNGLLVADAWDGRRWRLLHVHVWTESEIRAVSCPSTTLCWAVGWVASDRRGQDPLVERWDGTSWTATELHAPGRSPIAFFAGVSCPSPTWCMAAGSDTPMMGRPARGLTATWDGAAWTFRHSIRAGVWDQFAGVSCSVSSACVAAGRYFNHAQKEVPFAESWDGTRWHRTPTPTPGGMQGEFRAVSCPTGSACAAVGIGSNGMFVEAWDGSRWKLESVQVPPDPNTDGLLGVSCSSAGTCTAVGWWTSNSDLKTRNLAEVKGRRFRADRTEVQ